MILVSHGKQRLYPKELVPLERDNSSHLQYTFYVLRILNNPLRVFIGKRDSKNIKLKMATDGVKIIDGDLAHDTYEYIMELYDSGASGEIIKK